ncbi:electron transfer flavoprotein subunit alpha [Acetivibrio straminisolvens]|jgi:electron transfer flavoprotein alpha subunit|nr:electron transfer flavoprotein subunit alpha [Acetivibrio straminisolvens]
MEVLMAQIRIIKDRCFECMACIDNCPSKSIAFEGGKFIIKDNCNACGVCISSCSFNAIVFDEGQEIIQRKREYRGVFIYCEHENGCIKDVSLELICKGREIANQLGEELSVIVIGHKIDNIAIELTYYDVNKVIKVDNSLLETFNEYLYVDVLEQIINVFNPQIVLIGATKYGMALAPGVATRLKTGLTADCTELEIENETGLLLQTRPAFGGNLLARIICPIHRPQMATVRPGIFMPANKEFERKGFIEEVPVIINKSEKVEIVERVAKESICSSNAEIIIGIGKGIGKPENIPMVKKLANKLGAELGATRAVIDAGWMDCSYQIGQTGRVVSPKIYIALGISGAVQHTAGIISSNTIIAINRDKDAPIFKIASIGIVGDVMEILNLLLDEI